MRSRFPFIRSIINPGLVKELCSCNPILRRASGPLFRHLLLLRPSPLELKDRNTIVLPFPALPVLTKALCFWLWDAREHAHLHDNLARVCSSLRFHRTIRCEESTSQLINPTQSSQAEITYFPSFSQKYLKTLFPLPVALSS